MNSSSELGDSPWDPAVSSTPTNTSEAETPRHVLANISNTDTAPVWFPRFLPRQETSTPQLTLLRMRDSQPPS